MIKIGYQGIIGSNSEQAAKDLILKLNLTNTVLVPCISSINVINALMNNDIDYGVVAQYNNIGGIVLESQTALNNLRYISVESTILKIYHCLCMNQLNSIINTIYGHPQALIQCSEKLTNLYPDAVLIKYPDTALAGKDLNENVFNEHTAVLTTPNAARLYNLNILHQNLSNSEENYTTFILIHTIDS